MSDALLIRLGGGGSREKGSSSDDAGREGERRSPSTSRSSAQSWPTLFALLLLTLPPATHTLGVSPYGLEQVYLDGLGSQACQKHLEKTESRLSGFVYSHQPFGSPYHAARNCFLIFKAPKGYRIRLRVMDFGVGMEGGECKKDTLHVFDQDDSVLENVQGPGPIIGQFCGVIPNGTILATSSLNVLTLWWHTDEAMSSGPRSGFRLLWTVFRSSESGRCGPNEFACSDGDCIAAGLACDGVPHCLDGSDVRRRPSSCLSRSSGRSGELGLGGLSDAALGGLCFGSVLGSVLLCVGALICCRDRCQRPPKPSPPHQPPLLHPLPPSSDAFLLPRRPPLHPSASSSPTYGHHPPLLPPPNSLLHTPAHHNTYAI